MTVARMEVDGTTVTVEGDGSASLVFIHGWPDTARLWDPQVAALRDRYRCVRFTLPGFDAPSGAHGFDAVVERIRRVVERACPGERVTLVLHDWGCIFGFRLALAHPALVARIVAVDVGDAGSRRHVRELALAARAMIVAYQLWLALAWWIGGRVGDAMARGFARAVRAPAPTATIHAGMGYPYAVVWFGVAGGRPRERSEPPPVPTLFVHGERKPFPFHSQAWAREVDARPGSRVVGMPAGHWLTVTRTEAFNATLGAWLDATVPSDATVRLATPEDVPALFAIRTRVRENHLDLSELAARGVTPESVTGMLDTETASTWVAEADGRLLGFTMATADDGCVYALFVAPEAEGQGHGRRLLATAEAWLFASGWERIWLHTGAAPENRAHRLYRAAGWTQVGEADHGDVRYEKVRR